MYPTLSLGVFVIPTGAFTIILGLWASLSAVEWAAKRLTLPVKLTYGLAGTGLIAGMIGARLTFVFLQWSAYQDNLLGIIWPLNTGYNVWGGVIIGALGAFFYGRAKHLPFLATLDALVVGMVVFLLFVSLSDFLAGPGYGKSTTVLWGISQFGLKRHPVQLYEIGLGLLSLGVWWQLAKHQPIAGKLFFTTTTLYALSRLLTDAYHANAWLTDTGFHVVQLLSLSVALLCLVSLAQLSSTTSNHTEE